MPPLVLTREIWALAWPAILRNAAGCAADRLTLAFVGHYDASTVHYDGAGLGKMFSNVTGLSIGYGLNLGLATFCSQSFGAGRAEAENWIHIRRSAVVLSVALLFAGVAAAFCDPVLVALGQPPDVAAASASYAQVQAIGLPFYFAASSIQTVLDGLQRTRPGMHASLAANFLQLGLTALLMHPAALNTGYLGMAWARSAGGVFQLLILVAIVRRERLQTSVWTKPAGAAVGNAAVLSCGAIRVFLAVALPGALTMWMEWWAFEGLSVLCGLLPNATVLLAAHGTLFNVLVVTYMAFVGLSTALSVAVGKHIGADDSAAVPWLCVSAVAIAAVFVAATCAGLSLSAELIGEMFSADADVVAAVAANMPGAVLSVPGYALLMTLYGAIRGGDVNQRLATLGTAIGYGVGLPLAWLLGVRLHWPRPLLGVWMGNVTALTIAAGWITVIVVCKDWKSVRRADAIAVDSRRESLLDAASINRASRGVADV